MCGWVCRGILMQGSWDNNWGSFLSILDTEKQNIYTYISSNIIPSRKEAVRATDKVRIPDLHCEEAISQGQELEMEKYMQSSWKHNSNTSLYIKLMFWTITKCGNNYHTIKSVGKKKSN